MANSNFFKNLFLSSALLFLTDISFSQERTITGQVTTFKKIAIVNAQVKVASSKATVLTDTAGYFSVNCLPKDKIKVSARGFASQKVKLDEDARAVSVNLRLLPNKKNVDLAIGYGHINEADKSFAIENINNRDKLKFVNYTNIIDYIIDSSPSVMFRNGGIVIRGEGSLNSSNSALIILNGIEASLAQLAELNPMNVKSVDILKGSSAATYGVRGANGVILVATKK